MDEDMEMNEERGVEYDEQEDEQDEEQEGSEEEQYDEADVDEEDDEDDGGDADEDGEGEGLDEDDDNQERRSPSELRRRGSSAPNGHPRPVEETALSASTYLRKVQERRELFQPSSSYTDTTLGYQIEPIAAATHSCHVHAMSLSLDGQTLVTGGSDGFVRKYDVNATMNGKVMLTQNVRHGFVEGITRAGVLSAFWPNEEHPLPDNEKDRLVGAVHSLAVQQDSLWGVSGSESGNIHLYGLRHDPGATRHVFRRHKSVVSALAVTSDDKHMISGGWDRDVHQWDLNTGQIVRSFAGHAGQISSIAFRPIVSSRKTSSPNPTYTNTGRAEETTLHQNGASAEPAVPPTGISPSPQSQTIPEQTKPSAPPDQAVDLTGESPDSDVVMLDQPPDATSRNTKASGPKSEANNNGSLPSPSPAPILAANGADDPTEEELAFEAELNASLGLALEGSGSTKADGTRFGTNESGSSRTGGGNNLIVAGAEEDAAADDDLFGGETPTASISGDRQQLSGASSRPGAKPGGAAKRSDSDGDDSLFGDGDEDADADMDAEADADGEADDHEEPSSDEDMPLAGRAMAKSASVPTQDGPTFPSSATFAPSTLSLPTASVDTKPDASEPAVTAAVDVAPPTSVKKPLPKPSFGGFSIASSFDAPISTFSPDVMLTSTLSGQAILYDLRCASYTDASGKAKGVHSLPLPEKTSPWCQSAVFSSDGGKAYIGRKNESVDEWDLRMPRLARSLKLPSGSGPVFSLATMPNSRHIVCASYDNIRLWDTQFVQQSSAGAGNAGGELRVPFKIVAGHHGASVSSLLVDPSSKFLISASGDRGWMGSSTEAVILHDIQALY